MLVGGVVPHHPHGIGRGRRSVGGQHAVLPGALVEVPLAVVECVDFACIDSSPMVPDCVVLRVDFEYLGGLL